ncbi:amino acid ABC transporter substrate-binding protein [Clostridium sp.]|uniref:amino acid ABC transporter substrate-binding protein n=1 Tax=Clostridium sp. TaxID=1506 RepID=UPI0032172552
MKNILKRFGIACLILITAIGGVGCTKPSKDSSNGMEKIIIGFDNTFVPLGYMDEDGNTVGFDIDLAKETFKKLDMEVEFQPIDWAMKETELNSGNIDAIWNGYTLTEERKKKVSYTDSYLQNKQIIVTLKNSNIKTKDDIKGKILGTQQGSAALEAIEKDTEIINSLDGKTPVLYDTFDNVFRDLEAKRIDAIVADEVLARYYINQRGKEKYNVLKDNFGEENFVVACRKDDTELRDKINNILNEMKADKTFDEIYSKWF